jgi:hypothetical protein
VGLNELGLKDERQALSGIEPVLRLPKDRLVAEDGQATVELVLCEQLKRATEGYTCDRSTVVALELRTDACRGEASQEPPECYRLVSA